MRLRLIPPLAAVALVLSILPTYAAWKVESYKDRMTDRVTKYASLPAKAPDHGVSATLELTCDGLDGGRQFALFLSTPFTRGELSARLRLDEGKVRLLGLRTFSNPRRFPIITAPAYDLWGKKRFRVELSPRGSQPLFFDFDLAGIDKTIAVLPCNKRPTETFDDTAAY